MTREERELTITYLEEMKKDYIEGEGYERHPLPEYYAIEMAIKLLEQEPILDKIKAEIKALSPEPTAYDVVDGNPIKDAVWETLADVLQIINKYKAESEE